MKKCRSIFFAMVMTMLCSIRMVLPIYAAQIPEISVPVTISLSGTLPETEESFSINLKADSTDIPMPQGSKDGIYTMMIKGAGTKNFPVITYDKVGVYTYRIVQTAGNAQNCKYDDTVYLLKVTISNKEDHSGLEATVVIRPETQTEKTSSAEFHNEYETKTEETTKTSEPEQPQEETKSEPTEVLPTGDHSNVIFYVTLLVGSIAVVLVLLLMRKDDKQDEI